MPVSLIISFLIVFNTTLIFASNILSFNVKNSLISKIYNGIIVKAILIYL